MKELEKAMKIAEAAYEKALFKNAVSNLFVESIEAKEDKFLSRAEEIEEILSNMDEREFWSACGNYKLYHNDEVFDEQDLCLLMDEYDKLLDEDFFVNPHKEARRRTRKTNQKHKTYDVCGKSYKRYGKDKKVGKEYRGERLYNNGFGIKRTSVLFQEYDNDTDIPVLADADKGKYRSINGYAYPKEYITEEEQELFYKANLWEQRGRTNTGTILYLSFKVCRTDDGSGKITALIWAEEKLIYEGEDIEKAVEIFNVLTDRKEVK